MLSGVGACYFLLSYDVGNGLLSDANRVQLSATLDTRSGRALTTLTLAKSVSEPSRQVIAAGGCEATMPWLGQT